MSSWNKEEREARMGYLTKDQRTLIEIGDVVRIEAVDHDELTNHNMEHDVGYSHIVSYGEVVEIDDVYVYLRPEYCALFGGSMILRESVPDNRIERLVKRCIYNVVKFKADIILQPEG